MENIMMTGIYIIGALVALVLMRLIIDVAVMWMMRGITLGAEWLTLMEYGKKRKRD
ncbi:MAG: hypothetical protein AAFN11_20350 [Chloroflexota bacterium]